LSVKFLDALFSFLKRKTIFAGFAYNGGAVTGCGIKRRGREYGIIPRRPRRNACSRHRGRGRAEAILARLARHWIASTYGLAMTNPEGLTSRMSRINCGRFFEISIAKRDKPPC
jgi:hypothetical protein